MSKLRAVEGGMLVKPPRQDPLTRQRRYHRSLTTQTRPGGSDPSHPRHPNAKSVCAHRRAVHRPGSSWLVQKGKNLLGRDYPSTSPDKSPNLTQHIPSSFT